MSALPAWTFKSLSEKTQINRVSSALCGHVNFAAWFKSKNRFDRPRQIAVVVLPSHTNLEFLLPDTSIVFAPGIWKLNYVYHLAYHPVTSLSGSDQRRSPKKRIYLESWNQELTKKPLVGNVRRAHNTTNLNLILTTTINCFEDCRVLTELNTDFELYWCCFKWRGWHRVSNWAAGWLSHLWIITIQLTDRKRFILPFRGVFNTQNNSIACCYEF